MVYYELLTIISQTIQTTVRQSKEYENLNFLYKIRLRIEFHQLFYECEIFIYHNTENVILKESNKKRNE